MKRANVLKFPVPDVSSISRDPLTQEIILRLKPDSTLSADLVSVLGSLEALCSTIKRTQEDLERQERSERIVSAFQARCVEVARAYHRLRLSGMKHRAAQRTVWLDPQFSDLHGDLTDFGHWIKAYGSFVVAPVSVPKPDRASRPRYRRS